MIDCDWVSAAAGGGGGNDDRDDDDFFFFWLALAVGSTYLIVIYVALDKFCLQWK